MCFSSIKVKEAVTDLGIVKMEASKKGGIRTFTFIGITAVILILFYGTFWNSKISRVDTEKAVKSVSMLYLEELVKNLASKNT